METLVLQAIAKILSGQDPYLYTGCVFDNAGNLVKNNFICKYCKRTDEQDHAHDCPVAIIETYLVQVNQENP